ncbi:hypothetical protein [Brucella cytisi]|uniref:hypothetical protein n=1 Tax=Brucella cytisi TaxID=407152 RepID=UPI00313CA0AC
MDKMNEFRTYEQVVGVEEAMLELEKLLADQRFRASNRNKRFLRYVMERLFDGSANQIKAYSIAVDVFGRSTDFDPTLDPIVRIEATRLRTSLVHYYELYGRDHTLRIDLPKGGYVPAVLRQAPLPEVGSHPVSKSKFRFRHTHSLRSSIPFSDTRSRIFGIANVACAVCLLLVALFLIKIPLTQKVVISERPGAILAVTVDGKSNQAARELAEKLVIALARFRTINLLTSSGESGLPEPSQRAAYNWQSNAYYIEIDYRPDAPQPALWWQVSNQSNKEILVSQLDSNLGGLDSSDDLVGLLAYQIAGTNGAISNSELRQEYKSPTLGHGCVLRAYHAVRSPTQQKLEASRICLERSLRAQPNNADVYSALSLVLLAKSSSKHDARVPERTLKLADTAVQLAPGSAASARAEMESLFHAEKLDAAMAAGRRALILNPLDKDITAAFAAFLSATNRWNEAIPQNIGPRSEYYLSTL